MIFFFIYSLRIIVLVADYICEKVFLVLLCARFFFSSSYIYRIDNWDVYSGVINFAFLFLFPSDEDITLI